MSVEIRVPSLGESVTEATVARWFKQIGDPVTADEPIVELETDKVTLEFNAPASGTLAEILVDEGGEVEVGALLGAINEGAATVGAVAAAAPPATAAAPIEPAGTPAAAIAGLSPSVRKLIEEHGLDPATIAASGPKNNLTKGDVLAAIEARSNGGGGAAVIAADESAGRSAARSAAPPAATVRSDAQPTSATASVPAGPETPLPTQRPTPVASTSAPAADAKPGARVAEPKPAPVARPAAPAVARPGPGREQRVRMTRLRRRIAERLKEAQNTAAMLTTYNEADMSAVIALRRRYRDAFAERHGVRLGFMSVFVKASIEALKAYPAVNAEIDGDEIVYKNYYDIGVAVSTPSGLVVPVLRGADQLGFAEVEQTINELGAEARDGKLAMEALMGGTFTISNGGVYGSLMSSPILNPPQVGILGMHKIQERPVVVDGAIVIRPMMYLALSYDHRIVDGREAVSFLVRIKECVEDPERLLLAV